MRNRFFFIILATLIFSAIGISLVHEKFFKSQRLKLIDRQLSESSRELLDSDHFHRSISRPEQLDDAITAVLSGTRIGKVFVLKDSDGAILYQSFNLGLLNADLPTQPEWVTVNTATEYVRVHNIPVKSGRTMQVGLVLDRNFLDWEIIDRRVINYISALVAVLFVASVLLTLVLLSPLRLLISHLSDASSSLTNNREMRQLPKQLTHYARSLWARSDEFARLLNVIQRLIDRINLNYKLTRSWTFQMAHELKTPLSIIRSDTESRSGTGEVPREYAQSVISEVDQMSRIIGDFLDWAELENSIAQKDVHALRMASVLQSAASRLDKVSPGRIVLRFAGDFLVFADPVHLDQLVTNLLTNALKYSPSDRVVTVRAGNYTLTVCDHGNGFPNEVLERMGQPFNVGPSSAGQSPGNGLGLAWVSAVSKLYDWKIGIRRSAAVTEVTVHFPHQFIT